MQVDFGNEAVTLDGKSVSWNQIITGQNRFHVLKDDKSFMCEVLKADTRNKLFEIKINGNIYKAEVSDQFDELLRRLGMDKLAVNKVNVIKAPMPGLVLKLMVEIGKEIKEGDAVLILEAMKMENVLKSPGSGKVKSIKVKERDAVEKNQVLIELE
jgi:biotin carboxyl carrier protein